MIEREEESDPRVRSVALDFVESSARQELSPFEMQVAVKLMMAHLVGSTAHKTVVIHQLRCYLREIEQEVKGS